MGVESIDDQRATHQYGRRFGPGKDGKRRAQRWGASEHYHHLPAVTLSGAAGEAKGLAMESPIGLLSVQRFFPFAAQGFGRKLRMTRLWNLAAVSSFAYQHPYALPVVDTIGRFL